MYSWNKSFGGGNVPPSHHCQRLKCARRVRRREGCSFGMASGHFCLYAAEATMPEWRPVSGRPFSVSSGLTWDCVRVKGQTWNLIVRVNKLLLKNLSTKTLSPQSLRKVHDELFLFICSLHFLLSGVWLRYVLHFTSTSTQNRNWNAARNTLAVVLKKRLGVLHSQFISSISTDSAAQQGRDSGSVSNSSFLVFSFVISVSLVHCHWVEK